MILADSLGVCQKTVSNAIKEFVTALNHPAIVDEFLSCESKTLVLQVENRKRYCALDVLAVVGAHLRLKYVNFPVFMFTVHNSTVYNISRIHDVFSEGRVPSEFCLIGDSGYSNSSEVSTPIRNPRIDAQHSFNETHKKMRGTMCLKQEKAAKVVMECAVLHNIMIAMQCRPMRRLGRRLAQVAHPPQYV
ncbi:hypothetical protein ANCDUO_27325 [Ancylostoma duodenale]|uniref:DDE Tnp4 domain-containing protein n=1 Tax=Ancylostoma duodenale TaxID=51022 RepID=A0A0C2FCB5_9BILA|nr:hypothetical protein ANCDUO_27325 [Ancylostoma duodenale]